MKLTQELLRKILDYNPETGTLVWRKRSLDQFSSVSKFNESSWNKRFAGKEAGAYSMGYLIVSVFKSRQKAHRLAFLHYHGYLPKCIDHINGNRLDNRICNLREATFEQNGQNMRMRSSNKSGVKGVSWHKQAGKWEAGLQFNGKKVYLGLFSDLNCASDAVKLKRAELHGEFACNG